MVKSSVHFEVELLVAASGVGRAATFQFVRFVGSFRSVQMGGHSTTRIRRLRSAGKPAVSGGCVEWPSRIRLVVRGRRLELRIHRCGQRSLVRNRLTTRVGDVREPGGVTRGRCDRGFARDRRLPRGNLVDEKVPLVPAPYIRTISDRSVPDERGRPDNPTRSYFAVKSP